MLHLIVSFILQFRFGFFLPFLVDMLQLGSGCPQNFADPDPGSQKLADPTDMDAKQWLVQFLIRH